MIYGPGTDIVSRSFQINYNYIRTLTSLISVATVYLKQYAVANNEENIENPHHWTFERKTTGDHGFPSQNDNQ